MSEVKHRSLIGGQGGTVRPTSTIYGGKSIALRDSNGNAQRTSPHWKWHLPSVVGGVSLLVMALGNAFKSWGENRTQESPLVLYAWGNPKSFGVDSNEDIVFPTLMDESIVDAAAGGLHSFVLLPNGTARSAGYIENLDEYKGWLGVSGVTTGINEFQDLSQVVDNISFISPPPFKRIFTGNMHTVLVDVDGRAWTTGDNGYGQLCLGGTEKRLIPHKVPISGRIVNVAVGSEHTWLLHENGTAFGCGSNWAGQLGLGNYWGDKTGRIATSVSSPTKVEGLGLVEDISAGAYHSLLLTSSGIQVMGQNHWGQLCVFKGPQVWTPLVLTNIGKYDVVSIGAGINSSFILLKNGTLIACGSNSYGSLGDGTFESSNRQGLPKSAKRENTLTLFPSPVKKLRASSLAFSSFFSDREGVTYAMGANENGQLGVGDKKNSPVPKAVQFDRGVQVEHISSGWGHTLAAVREIKAIGGK